MIIVWGVREEGFERDVPASKNFSTEGRSDKENKRQESTSQSSSQSISHSSDKDEAEGFIKDTLQVIKDILMFIF